MPQKRLIDLCKRSQAATNLFSSLLTIYVVQATYPTFSLHPCRYPQYTNTAGKLCYFSFGTAFCARSSISIPSGLSFTRKENVLEQEIADLVMYNASYGIGYLIPLSTPPDPTLPQWSRTIRILIGNFLYFAKIAIACVRMGLYLSFVLNVAN